MLKFIVDFGLCTRCGLCVQDCPARIIKQEGGAVPDIAPDQEPLCYQCQHCLAVCPTAALSILGRNPADSIPLTAGSLPSLDQASRYVRGRRTVRQYRDKNVESNLIQKLLATLANVPTGVNRRELTFTVIDDKAVMQRLRVQIYKALAAAGGTGRVPEYLNSAASAYFEQGTDRVFRGAPHALIISAPLGAPCPREDVVLALAYFEFLAQSAGLGTVWWGMFKSIMESLPELKPLVNLSGDHAYYAMLFGTPAIHYARTVQRDDAAVIRRVE
jgi:nitroreductase/NAD-dependent dihydropyrimidine dehydrogenase PreA subunit